MASVSSPSGGREEWDGVLHTLPRYYKPSEMSGLTGGAFEYRIAVEWFLNLWALRSTSSTFGSGSATRHAALSGGSSSVEPRPHGSSKSRGKGPFLLPGEAGEADMYVEGATRQITVNAYERSREAVQQCKAACAACAACGIDFWSDVRG